MFETRLKYLLAGFALCLAVLVGRLVQLQVVQAEHYRQAAEQAMVFKTTSLPFVRGSILDRGGRLLVCDEPCWDVRIDYAVMAADVEWSVGAAERPAVKRQLARLKRNKRYPDARTNEEIERHFREELDRMWRAIARHSAIESPLSVDDLRGRSRELYERIARIRKRVEQRRGFESPVAEELNTQIILSGISSDQAIEAREALGGYPWVHVEPSSTRAFQGELTSLAHLLGRIGRVEAEDIENDPAAEDAFARYLPNEPVGVSGVESAAERRMRGRRGEITRDRTGRIIEEIPAQDGQDVRLTIDTELQTRMCQLLGETVRRTPDASGGSIVVLEVPSREALAVVSWPSYDPRRFDELYAELRDDTEHLPLVFRAVANHYAPGSIVKPLVCLAGLVNGKISLDSREECRGYLLEDRKDEWRCWEVHGANTRMAHGSIDVVEALIGSCNIFMYRLGERLGIDRMTEAFDMFGIGRLSAGGLREEVYGINPTREWFARRDHRLNQRTPITGGHLRNFSIGQGELTVTPLQAANIMAVYATGKYRPVSIVQDADPTHQWTLPGSSAQWAAIRKGIFGVVNDPDGTAYKYAHFEHPDYVLCGKTGSATTASWPTAFRVVIGAADGSKHEVVLPARTRQDAIDAAMADWPGHGIDPAEVEVVRRWPRNPPTDDRYSHAWFAGYLQAVDADHHPIWSTTPRIAFAVLVEFGGSGGRTSGPLANRVAREILDLYGPELKVDPPSSFRRTP